MTIGKRKGSAAKGVGGVGTNGVNKVGGSLSKNDHWYLHQAFGMAFDPGSSAVTSATGGVIAEYTSGSDVYRSHTFLASGSLVVEQLSDNPLVPSSADILVVETVFDT